MRTMFIIFTFYTSVSSIWLRTRNRRGRADSKENELLEFNSLFFKKFGIISSPLRLQSKAWDCGDEESRGWVHWGPSGEQGQWD